MNRNISDIISQTRKNCGMTQEEFASRLGVTPQAVSREEKSTLANLREGMNDGKIV